MTSLLPAGTVLGGALESDPIARLSLLQPPASALSDANLPEAKRTQNIHLQGEAIINFIDGASPHIEKHYLGGNRVDMRVVRALFGRVEMKDLMSNGPALRVVAAMLDEVTKPLGVRVGALPFVEDQVRMITPFIPCVNLQQAMDLKLHGEQSDELGEPSHLPEAVAAIPGLFLHKYPEMSARTFIQIVDVLDKAAQQLGLPFKASDVLLLHVETTQVRGESVHVPADNRNVKAWVALIDLW